MPHQAPDTTLIEDGLVTKCPGCSTDVTGNFCAQCGEKIISSSAELSIKHFFRDVYHELFDVDSRFLTTLKSLLLRPGFLTHEWLNGRRKMYIKPFRLYISLVVIHFVIFAMIPSGDMYNVDRFPPIRLSTFLSQAIQKKISASESPVELKARLNEKIKDDLSIVLYVVVFAIAVVIKVLFPKSNRVYVEHLVFVFHIFAFAFARNLLMIPLVMMDWMLAAILFAVATQIIYAVLAIKLVYRETLAMASLKVLVIVAAVGVFFFISLHIVILTALAQV
jgi:hypothetical protein